MSELDSIFGIGEFQASGQQLPVVEILRGGLMVYSSRTANETRDDVIGQTTRDLRNLYDQLTSLEAALDQAGSGLEGNTERARLRTAIERTLPPCSSGADSCHQWTAGVDDTSRSTIRFDQKQQYELIGGTYVESVNFSSSAGSAVGKGATVTLGNASPLVPVGLQDTGSPFTDTQVALSYDTYPNGAAPQTAADLFDPAAAAGTYTTFPLSVYNIDRTVINLKNDGSVSMTLNLKDGLQRMADNAIVDPYEIPAGTAPIPVMTGLIKAFAFGDPNVISRPTDALIGPMSWEQGTSYLSILSDMAEAFNYRVYVETDGTFVIAPNSEGLDPDLGNAQFDLFPADIIEAERIIRRNAVVNGVIVRGEAVGGGADPVESRRFISTGGLAYSEGDTDSVVGPFPIVKVSGSISTQAEADALAEQTLAAEGGKAESLQLKVSGRQGTRAGARPGQIVNVELPSIGASGRWRIASVSGGGSGGIDNTGISVITIVMEDRA